MLGATPRMPAGHPGYIFMHIYACIYTYACIFMHIVIYLCMYLCLFMHIHAYLCIFHACFMHMYAYSCIFVHIYVYSCICLIQRKYVYWTQSELYMNHYRNNQHIFRSCTGMTPWHGGGLGAVRLSAAPGRRPDAWHMVFTSVPIRSRDVPNREFPPPSRSAPGLPPSSLARQRPFRKGMEKSD